MDMSCLFNRYRFAAFSLTILCLASPFLESFSASAREKGGKAQNRALPSVWREDLDEGRRRLQAQQYELAEACLRRAVHACRKSKLSKPDDLVLCYSSLAAVLQKQGETEEALASYKKALGILVAFRGEQDSSLLPVLWAQGAIWEKEGEFKRAKKAYEHALAIALKHKEDDAFSLDLCWQRLGRVNSELGAGELAGACYASSLASYMSGRGFSSGVFLEDLLGDFTDLLEKQEGGATNSASWQMQEELLKDRLVEIPGAPFQGTVFGQLAVGVLTGNAQANCGREITQDKIDSAKSMVAADIKSLGAEHPSVARDLNGLGALYLAQANEDEARLAFTRALNIYEKLYSADSLLIRQARSRLRLLSELQKARESGEIFSATFLEELPKIPRPAQNVDTAIRLARLASLAWSVGNKEEAEKLSQWAVAAIYASLGGKNLLLSCALLDYASVLRSSGKPERAELVERNAQAIAREVALAKIVAN
jgi:tetratricopeptide (TPR) repeat protein